MARRLVFAALQQLSFASRRATVKIPKHLLTRNMNLPRPPPPQYRASGFYGKGFKFDASDGTQGDLASDLDIQEQPGAHSTTSATATAGQQSQTRAPSGNKNNSNADSTSK